MALNKKLASALLFGLSTALAGTAQAVDITLSSAMGAVGGSVMVTFDYAAMDADDTAGFQFDIMFDDVALTATDFSMCGANAPASSNLISCTNPSPGLLRVLIGDIAIPVEEIMPLNIPAFGNFTFMINQPGTHALTFTNASASDIAGGGVAINGMDGSISGAITGASGFASAPAPGSTIDLGSVDVGAASAAMNITVSEIGDMTLDVTAVAITGANAGDFASATAPFMIADGGADVMVDVNCSPTSRGALTGTLELTNNSVNDPTPQYTLNCAGLAPNVAVSSMTVNMAGVIGGTNPTASFDVTNAQDGFTNDATMATVVDGATAEITVTNALPGTLPVDSTNAVDLMCDATNAGMFTDTVSVQYFDPVAGATAMIDVTVNCDIANAFPVYESVPTAGSTLDFMGVPNGGSGGPLGVDVGNTMAVGGAALNVTAAAITGADAAQFTLGAFAPFSVAAGVGPDGTDDITVTCDPTSAGVFAAMLVVNTDDPAEPAGGFTYPLACTGTVNSQFSSNPAPGAVSFGIVAPGSSVDTIITMSNGAGAADDLTIDCALDPLGAPEITLVSPVFPQTVVPGASVDVTLNCSTTTPATVTGTLSCSTNDPNNLTVTYDLTCIGQPLIVPTLSQWGLLAMALLMMFGGVIAFRLRQN